MKNKKRVKNVIQVGDVRPLVAMANFIRIEVGRVWGPRTIQDWELVYVVRGRLSYECVGENTIIGYSGNVFCIPPDKEHTLRCVDESPHAGAAISCIHLEFSKGKWMAGDYTLAKTPPLVTSTDGALIFNHLFKKCSDTFEGYDPYRVELVNTIAREICLRLASIWTLGVMRTPSVRTRRMQEFLRARLRKNVSRHDLAKAFNMTPEHVNVVFKREVGVSPGVFINRERVMLAYELLTYEGLSVKETAYQVGFSDQFHFSKVFKKTMGIPPSRLLHRYGQLF